MLHITVRELLLLIQTHALPWLVLMKQTEVIQKIAEARGEAETWQSIMDPANIGPILALLFIQDVPDIENFVKLRLTDVSAHFRPLSLTDLILSQSSAVALELLKTAGDAGDDRKLQARRALQIVAGMHSGRETRTKKSNSAGRFLNAHVLGMMARLTDVINDTVAASSPVQEQRRCLRAVEEMIAIGREYAQNARPQVSQTSIHAPKVRL